MSPVSTCFRKRALHITTERTYAVATTHAAQPRQHYTMSVRALTLASAHDALRRGDERGGRAGARAAALAWRCQLVRGHTRSRAAQAVRLHSWGEPSWSRKQNSV